MMQCLSGRATQHCISRLTRSYKGMLPLRHHWCANSSGMLLLFITYFPVTHPSSNFLNRRSVRLCVNLLYAGLSSQREGEMQRRVNERRGWKRLLAEENFIHCCAWIAMRWWNSAPRATLTCIHRMCRHLCPGTPRLGEGPLFLLLLAKWREDISDFHKRWQSMKITVSPDCYVVWISLSLSPWLPAQILWMKDQRKPRKRLQSIQQMLSSMFKCILFYHFS